ncbi:SdpA family antimicrobial peptide system protein [Streptomyces sp. SID5910]|uniref:SdpA family antimicrobial peptide system protein n=1 Tax=Streptomyces sp. SID5910 TaxID=2690312 RepID=UPI0031F779B8
MAILYVAQSFLPHNVVSLPAQESARKLATVTAPQGWAFFTKSAKDPSYAPYRMVDGHWKNVSLTPHSRPSNLFGFDRASRTQGIEAALMLRQAGTRWTTCDSADTVSQCLVRAESRPHVTNPSPAPTLCGRAAVVEMTPVPWAWRDLSPEHAAPTRVASWQVTCR